MPTIAEELQELLDSDEFDWYPPDADKIKRAITALTPVADGEVGRAIGLLLRAGFKGQADLIERLARENAEWSAAMEVSDQLNIELQQRIEELEISTAHWENACAEALRIGGNYKQQRDEALRWMEGFKERTAPITGLHKRSDVEWLFEHFHDEAAAEAARIRTMGEDNEQ